MPVYRVKKGMYSVYLKYHDMTFCYVILAPNVNMAKHEGIIRANQEVRSRFDPNCKILLKNDFEIIDVNEA